MIETLVNIGSLGFEGAICVLLAVTLQRVGRIEKDVARIAESADENETSLARLQGQFEGLKRFN